MKYFKQFLAINKMKVFIVLLLLLGQVIGTLFVPKLVATMIDQGILKNDFNVVINIGIWMFIFALVTTLISTIGSWVTSHLAALFGKEMRTLLFKKTQELSIQQFDEIGISSLITRSTSDITNLQQMLGMLLQLVFPAPIILIVSICMTASINIPLAIIQFFFIFLLFILSIFVIKRSNRLSSQIQTKLDAINKVVRESITGVRVIRAFGCEDYEEKRSNGAFTSYASNMIQLNRLFAIFFPAVWTIMGLIMVVALALGGAFTLQGSMQIGQISAVTEYAILSIGYCIMAVSTLTTLPKAKACLKRLETVLDTKPSILSTSINQTFNSSATNAIEFNDVTFAYDGAEQPVLNHISFAMKNGETTAIIGSTGAGKSTLVDLLLRIHQQQSGSIKVHGIDIRDCLQNDLRNEFGYVPQKAFLFSGTIQENLRLGHPHASDDDLWQALEISQAKDFVLNLNDQLNSFVAQGGTNFSGGQRQRLSIARALTKNSSILLFDDCFSALDVKTDKALRKALHEKAKHKTKLIIAQRVSSIMDADQILVLDEGAIVAKGTHSELLSTCELYQSIVASQSQLKEVTS